MESILEQIRQMPGVSGAFVCGEETALIQSIEGNRGMPRHRPPYPVQRGLWGQPVKVFEAPKLTVYQLAR